MATTPTTARSLPTGRPGRLLALLVTLAVLGALWLVAGAPLLAYYEEGAARLEARAAVADRMAALAGLLPTLKERAASASADATVSFTLPGSSDAVAAATLQNMVQEMSTAAGANPQSIETLPGRADGPYRLVGIKVSLNTQWPVLIALLRAIATAGTPLLVDDLEIHALPGMAVVAGSSPSETPLDTSLSIYAFRAAGGGEAP